MTSLTMAWFGLRRPEPTLLAWCWLTITGMCLALVDIECKRLPRVLVFAMGVGGLLVFVTAAFVEAQLGSLVSAVAAAGTTAVIVIAIALVAPGQLGGGDVTLYPVLALYMGWCGWATLLLGVVSGALLTAGWALAMLLTGRAGLRSRIAAGPTLILGALVAIAFGPDTGGV